MRLYLILRLRNAAIAADQRRDFAMAELLTEAIHELEKEDEERQVFCASGST